MSPEEAYEEARRRIREAENSVVLSLNNLQLNRLPPELEDLSSLILLNLSECKQLSDLAPLAGLTKLQSLGVIGSVIFPRWPLSLRSRYSAFPLMINSTIFLAIFLH
jgi:hypothetical protein